MTQPEVLSKLQGVFDRLFLDPVVLHPALRASEVPEWDSLMQTSLVVAVEREFAVRFRVGEVERTQNVGEFVELISRRAREP